MGNPTLLFLPWFVGSEQSGNDAVVIHIDLGRCGDFGQARHGHDIAGQHNNESCAGRHLHIFNGDRKVFRRTELGHIVREAVLRLGDTDGATVK